LLGLGGCGALHRGARWSDHGRLRHRLGLLHFHRCFWQRSGRCSTHRGSACTGGCGTRCAGSLKWSGHCTRLHLGSRRPGGARSGGRATWSAGWRRRATSSHRRGRTRCGRGRQCHRRGGGLRSRRRQRRGWKLDRGGGAARGRRLDGTGRVRRHRTRGRGDGGCGLARLGHTGTGTCTQGDAHRLFLQRHGRGFRCRGWRLVLFAHKSGNNDFRIISLLLARNGGRRQSNSARAGTKMNFTSPALSKGCATV
jgi:hypothetical protein